MWFKSKFEYMWCVVAAILCAVEAEFFTAISDVEPLLVTHQKIIDDLDQYIHKEQERLKVLKKQLDIYKVEHMKAMEDIPNYLGNPINAFTLIKRLTIDLDFIEDSIQMGTEYNKNITMYHEPVMYPTLEDLTGAAQAMTRLQDTYLLKVSELSEGKLNGVIYRSDDPSSHVNEGAGAISRMSTIQRSLVKIKKAKAKNAPHTKVVKYGTPMSAGDCYELGRVLYNDNDYTNALSWMMEAHRKFKDETAPYPFTEVDILEYISYIHYLLGDSHTALEWTKNILAIDPNHRAQSNIPQYQKTISEQEDSLQGNAIEEEIKRNTKAMSSTMSEEYKSSYEAMCRGEMDVPANISKRFKCRYLTENHPFLKLAPIKMEQVYLQPDIMLFHEVLSEDEVQQIKELAQPRFERAKINDVVTGTQLPVNHRISKASWLSDDETPVVTRVSQRIADFTGLSLASAESLQVANYGIGGHYEPNYDFKRKHEPAFNIFNDNRIATVLFYMSEVAQGGATVFTELGLSVFPVARAAAFWYNLHPSGEGDYATRHAAFPVLRGSKWVCNKWIHQSGQELIKPCNLEYQQEGIVHPIPKPVLKTFRYN